MPDVPPERRERPGVYLGKVLILAGLFEPIVGKLTCRGPEFPCHPSHACDGGRRLPVAPIRPLNDRGPTGRLPLLAGRVPRKMPGSVVAVRREAVRPVKVSS